MGRKVIDLTGKRYGAMTVLGIDPSWVGGHKISALWRVLCDCGTERSIRSDVLRSNNQQSCGCLRGEGGRFQTKYGIPQSALWRWTNMMRRCYDPVTEKDSRNYKERGIKVCAAWHDPRTFYDDIGNPPFEGASIDRRDNDGDYTPLNCRWATRSEQNKNRRPFKIGARH